MSEAKAYRNFINGEWVSAASGKSFENRNPADTSEVVGFFQDSDASDVEQAVDAAREAYRKWRLTPAPKRAEYVYKVGEILIRRKEEYAQCRAQHRRVSRKTLLAELRAWKRMKNQ